MAVYHKRQPKPLSSSSFAVYNAIEEYYSLNGQSPSHKEISEMTGLKSKSTISHHLNRLQAFGYISRVPHAVRAIVPIHYPRVYYRKAVK
jgi:SOS-response transcriptional repressor LexA